MSMPKHIVMKMFVSLFYALTLFLSHRWCNC